MLFIIAVLILVVVLYISSFSNRDKNLDYKLAPQYEKSGKENKLRMDVIEGLKININKEILNNDPFSRVSKRKEVEYFIDMRESTFYLHIETLSQQHKLSHDATFDTIFSACNYVRIQYGIQPQTTTFNK